MIRWIWQDSVLIGCAVMYRSADGTWSIGPPTDLVYLEAQRQPWLRSTENDDGAHCPKGLTWEVLPMKKREQLRPWRLRSPMRASARASRSRKRPPRRALRSPPLSSLLPSPHAHLAPRPHQNSTNPVCRPDNENYAPPVFDAPPLLVRGRGLAG